MSTSTAKADSACRPSAHSPWTLWSSLAPEVISELHAACPSMAPRPVPGATNPSAAAAKTMWAKRCPKLRRTPPNLERSFFSGLTLRQRQRGPWLMPSVCPLPWAAPKPPPPAPCRQTGNLQLLLPALQQVGSHRTTPITPPGTPKSQVHPELTAQPDRSARGRCTCRQACKGVRRQPAPCSAVRPRGCPFPAHPGPLRT